MITKDFQDLIPEYKNLVEQAKAASQSGYAVYSGYRVGAAALCADGSFYLGANFENASFPCSICAEQAALACANSSGHRDVKAIAIFALKAQQPIAPCGLCRQVIAQMASLSNCDIEIIMSDANMQKVRLAKISQLLPDQFKLNG